MHTSRTSEARILIPTLNAARERAIAALDRADDRRTRVALHAYLTTLTARLAEERAILAEVCQ